MRENSHEVLISDVSVLAGNRSVAVSEGADGLRMDFSAIVLPENHYVNLTPLVKDEALFYAMLREFHTSFPEGRLIVEAAGKVLDLHSCYKEVTARGGFEQVIKEKKWDEVALALNLTCNIPEPSPFPQQKQYADVLYHFDQVYYFPMQGKLPPSPGLLPALMPVKSLSTTKHCRQNSSSRKRKRRKQDSNSPSAGSLVGKTLSGSVFDGGYLVTVIDGSEKLNGLLFHGPGSGNKQFSAVPGLVSVANSENKSQSVELEASKRKGKKDGKKDPDAPLRIRSAYHFFCAEQRERLKKKTHERPTGGIQTAWKALSEYEKMPYMEMSRQDKERRRREIQAHKERQKEAQTCKIHHHKEEAVRNPVDEQEKQAKLLSSYRQEDDDCYRVSMDMAAEIGDFGMDLSDVQAFADDIFCSGWLMDDSELLAHVNRAWSASGDVLSYLPLFDNAA